MWILQQKKSEQHFQPHIFRRFFFQPTCASLLAARRGIMHFISHFDVEDLQGKNLGFLSSHLDLGITCWGQVSHVFQRHLHQGRRPGDVNTVFSGWRDCFSWVDMKWLGRSVQYWQYIYIICIYIYGAALATPPPPPTNGYGWTVSSGSSGPPPCGLWWWYGSSGPPPPVACGGGMVLLVPPPCGLWWWYVSMLVCWYVGMLVCMYVGMYVCWYVCMLVCMYVGMYVCWYVCMYDCMIMYVCMYGM